MIFLVIYFPSVCYVLSGGKAFLINWTAQVHVLAYFLLPRLALFPIRRFGHWKILVYSSYSIWTSQMSLVSVVLLCRLQSYGSASGRTLAWSAIDLQKKCMIDFVRLSHLVLFFIVFNLKASFTSPFLFHFLHAYHSMLVGFRNICRQINQPSSFKETNALSNKNQVEHFWRVFFLFFSKNSVKLFSKELQ